VQPSTSQPVGGATEYRRIAPAIVASARVMETPRDPIAGALVPLPEGAQLFELLGAELRRMAGRIAAREVGHTMQPTALVNELFMKFCGSRPRSWNDEVHFMRSAAVTMRTILLDHKKRRLAQKRGGGVAEASLDAVLNQLEVRCGGDLLGVHEALSLLAAEDSHLAEYVSLRFFGGRTNAEASRILGIAERTGDSHWQFARAWLQRRLRP
jgi:RNA polymerase sigma factor (TIGR02999 family)